MQIIPINSFQQFDKLQEDWDAAYERDLNSTPFVSWAWLRGWCEATPYDWLVLGARPNTGSSFIAFMVLGLQSLGKGKGQNLYMGGHPFSCHTGFVCLPEYVETAIPSFATFIQKKLKWIKFDVREVFDQRLNIFLKCFSTQNFQITELDDTPCPYIVLPKSWDKYLRGVLSKRHRKRIFNSRNRAKRLNDFRVTHINKDNWNDQIDIFLKLYTMKWEQFTNFDLNLFRGMFIRCFHSNCLWVTVLWDEKTPFSAKAGFLDQKNKIFSAYNGGWDHRYADLSPGIVTSAYCIRYAIEQGYKIYDFLRGAEDHKYSFGATDRFNKNIIIRRTRPRIVLLGYRVAKSVKNTFK